MGWLYSHIELLPKLWGARRPPKTQHQGTYTVALAQAWESPGPLGTWGHDIWHRATLATLTTPAR